MTRKADKNTPARVRARFVFDRITSQIGTIIMSAADDAVNAANDQLQKAKGEIDSLITDLESQDVSPETLDRLRNLSQSFDDVVPDPTPDPTTGQDPTTTDTPTDGGAGA